MSKQISDDFLWFSYFGITKEDARSNCGAAILACINRAYRDVCRRLEYRYSVESLKNIDDDKRVFQNNKDKFLADDKPDNKQSAVFLLKDCICSLLKNLYCKAEYSRAAFDLWHQNTCDSLIELANSLELNLFKYESFFSYGHAQKWVNLSLKNMFVMGLWHNLDGIEEYLHVTIDSYILKAAAKRKNGNEYALKECIAPIEHNDDCYVSRCTYYHEDKDSDGKKSCPWSKMNKNDYLRLQCDIKRAIDTKFQRMTPFEWENKAWIEQAKIENKEKN